jgi:hypothetical protein
LTVSKSKLPGTSGQAREGGAVSVYRFNMSKQRGRKERRETREEI